MKIKTILLITALAASVLFTGCSKDGENVPSGMQNASSEYVDYDFFVPDDWLVGQNDGCVNARKSDSVLANVTVMASRVDGEIDSTDAYWKKYTDSFNNAFTDFELVEDESVLLDGHEAHKYVYTGTFTDVSAKYMQVICVRGSTVYIFTYTAAPDKYDDYIKDVNKMLEEFRFH